MMALTPREPARGVKSSNSMEDDASIRLDEVFDDDNQDTLLGNQKEDEDEDNDNALAPQQRHGRSTALHMIERPRREIADPTGEEYSVQSSFSSTRRSTRGGRHRLTSASKRTSISQESAMGLSKSLKDAMNGSLMNNEEDTEQEEDLFKGPRTPRKHRSRRLSERVKSRRSVVTSDNSTVQTAESSMTNNSKNSRGNRVRNHRGDCMDGSSRRINTEKPQRTRSAMSKESADSIYSVQTAGVEHETTPHYEKPPLRRSRTGGSENLMASSHTSGQQSRRRHRRSQSRTRRSESIDRKQRAVATAAAEAAQSRKSFNGPPERRASTSDPSKTPRRSQRKPSVTPSTPRMTPTTPRTSRKPIHRKSASAEPETPRRESPSIEPETPRRTRHHQRSITSYGEMKLKSPNTPSSEKQRCRSIERDQIQTPSGRRRSRDDAMGSSIRRKTSNQSIERQHASCSKIPSFADSKGERRRRPLRRQLSKSSINKDGDGGDPIQSPSRTHSRPKRNGSQESFHESFVVMPKEENSIRSSSQRDTGFFDENQVAAEDPDTANNMDGSQFLMPDEFPADFDGSEISSSEEESNLGADNSTGVNGSNRRMRESSRRMRDSTSGRSRNSADRSTGSGRRRDSSARMKDSRRMRESGRMRDSRRRDSSALTRDSSSRRRRDNGGRRGSTHRRRRRRSVDGRGRELADSSKDNQNQSEYSDEIVGSNDESFFNNDDAMGEVLQFDPTQIGMVQRVKQISSDKGGFEINGQVGQIAEIVDPVTNLQDFVPSKGPLFNLFDDDPGFEDVFDQQGKASNQQGNEGGDDADSPVSLRRKSLIRRGGNDNNDENEESDDEDGRRDSGMLRDFVTPATLGYEDTTAGAPKQKSKSTLSKASGYLRSMLNASHTDVGDADDDKSQVSQWSSRSGHSEKSGKSARKSIKALFTGKKNKGTLLLDEDLSMSDSDFDVEEFK